MLLFKLYPYVCAYIPVILKVYNRKDSFINKSNRETFSKGQGPKEIVSRRSTQQKMLKK